MSSRRGPLTGVRVVEFVGIGPGPHCAMMLADLGAEVLRIDRKGGNGWPNAVHDRGRACLEIDIRTAEGRDQCLEALSLADVLIEGMRPGVMERLGLGPEVVMERNRRLIYGRMTGWGQTGPMASMAGHDINYIALAGALAPIGQPGEPATVPLNLIGDFGGGSMLLTVGICAALFERESSGLGQVIDAAIVDGVSSLMSFFDGLAGTLALERDRNLLGGAAPFYRSYMCKDGREMSVGALEPAFFKELIEILQLPEFLDGQDPDNWLDLTNAMSERFREQDQSHWIRLFDQTDACVVPVLTLEEAKLHPHLLARDAYVVGGDELQVSAVPRFSRTPGRAALDQSGDAQELLKSWRYGNKHPTK